MAAPRLPGHAHGMTKRQTPARVLASALVTTWLVVGCVPVDPGGAGGEGATTTIDGTDLQVCGAACQTLIGCGADLDQTGCKDDCLSLENAPLVSCFRSTTATCDGLSSCVWSALCSGATPTGSASCEAGQQCFVNCGGNPDPLCPCACQAQVSSNQAADVYALYVCIYSNCKHECGQIGDPVSCDSCITGECSPEDAQCN